MTGGLLLCLGLVFSSLATKLFHVYLALGLVAGIYRLNVSTLHSYNTCMHVRVITFSS